MYVTVHVATFGNLSVGKLAKLSSYFSGQIPHTQQQRPGFGRFSITVHNIMRHTYVHVAVREGHTQTFGSSLGMGKSAKLSRI